MLGGGGSIRAEGLKLVGYALTELGSYPGVCFGPDLSVIGSMASDLST